MRLVHRSSLVWSKALLALGWVPCTRADEVVVEWASVCEVDSVVLGPLE
jgi:hypothetical protein